MKPTLTLLAAVVLAPLAALHAADAPPKAIPAGSSAAFSDSQSRWLLGANAEAGINHLGLDSEGTGRQGVNLLMSPVQLTWDGMDKPVITWGIEKKGWTATCPTANGKGTVKWTVQQEGDDMVWRLAVSGGAIGNARFKVPLNPLITPTTILPHDLNAQKGGVGPWLFVAPDFGHLSLAAEGDIAVNSTLEGVRAGSATTGVVVPPERRGEAAVEILRRQAERQVKPRSLMLVLHAAGVLTDGKAVTLRFHPCDLTAPAGVNAGLWNRMRRSYLDHWQPCATWAGPQRNSVLANNGLSDPASCSLFYYSEPMLFWNEPVKGVNVAPLLRHSLNYWLTTGSQLYRDGHINSYFDRGEDLNLFQQPALIIAAWHYWTLTRDEAWLKENITKLHRIASYLARHDQDHDGLLESPKSGNAWTLRQPDRSDFWGEFINFGGKNAYVNAYAFAAWKYLAEMLDAAGQPEGAAYYRSLAEKLRVAYVEKFLSKENGWFVSWISADGEVHDYCHTFVNGMAVAYGIVPPDQGREIMERVVRKSHEIGFENWYLGVPANLLPVRISDLLGPEITIDGKNTGPWWKPGGRYKTEEEAGQFGQRYCNGSVHPALTWPYLLGLQVAGLNEEADRIFNAMLPTAEAGLFQGGIGGAGAEHFSQNGRPSGYEGYLPESWNFLMTAFTRDPANRERLLGPLKR
jgi:hypothetical protein